MDTPSFPPPRDATEQDILDNLVTIRDKLQLLKHNRKTYMQKQDIIPLYQDTIEQVRRLTEARPQDQVLEKNRVDRVLDSCFLLLSLSFMTIGQNNTAPAAYALTVTTERLLDHLAEVDLFSAKDLESLEETLTTLTRNVKNGAAEQSPYLVTLLLNRLESCRKSLVKLQKRLEKYEKPLPKVHETLISILRSISWANTRSKFSASEVKKLRKQLTDIEKDIKEGKYKKEDGEWPSGSADVDNLLRKCLLWADIVLDRGGEIPDSFKPLYTRLVRIRNDLDKLSITGRWALREADLYDFTRELDWIDEQRINGNWVDEDGREAELYVQRTLLYLVRRSYGYVYFLMLSSKPVSEALLPIFNQLQTLKTCLVEVKNSGGVSSVRELYPYSMKLNSIDNLRVDGKFIFNGDIPEGQGSVNELLAECFELNYDLRVAAESNAEGEEDEDDATPGDVKSAEADPEAALAAALAESRLDGAATATDTPAKA